MLNKYPNQVKETDQTSEGQYDEKQQNRMADEPDISHMS